MKRVSLYGVSQFRKKKVTNIQDRRDPVRVWYSLQSEEDSEEEDEEEEEEKEEGDKNSEHDSDNEKRTTRSEESKKETRSKKKKKEKSEKKETNSLREKRITPWLQKELLKYLVYNAQNDPALRVNVLFSASGEIVRASFSILLCPFLQRFQQVHNFQHLYLSC